MKEVRQAFLDSLRGQLGNIHKVGSSKSLFSIGNDAARVFIRYSKLYGPHRTWYGLPQSDLHELEGHKSFLCFLWDGQAEPLLLPFDEYEESFRSAEPSPDGQYKVHIFMEPDATVLYIPRSGRFNVEGHFGWDALVQASKTSQLQDTPLLTHSQVQTLLGSIGMRKGYDIWIPRNDVAKLDWSLAESFSPVASLPASVEKLKSVVEEIDVLWLERGANRLRALFEVEHTTSIYSGLLRFNDVHLALTAKVSPQYTIVADEGRRSRFTSQLNRPTFHSSKLDKICTFLDYQNVHDWYKRLSMAGQPEERQS